MPIHPTAIVDPAARIAESAEIGPFCIIGGEVEIGPRTRLMANNYLEGPIKAARFTGLVTTLWWWPPWMNPLQPTRHAP